MSLVSFPFFQLPYLSLNAPLSAELDDVSLATAASPSSSAGALGTLPASAGSSWMSPAGAVSGEEDEEPKTRAGAAEMVAQMDERLSLVRLRKASNWLSGCLQMRSRASV